MQVMAFAAYYAYQQSVEHAKFFSQTMSFGATSSQQVIYWIEIKLIKSLINLVRALI